MTTDSLATGSHIPPFGPLPATNGRNYSLADFTAAGVLAVVFSCNHCPYVRAYEDRMIDIQRRYRARGVQLVAINSNETVHYPEDNFEEMVKRAASKEFPFPYLRDEDQSVAGAFGATHTPEFFVFDAERRLRYHGKFDDNYRDPSSVKEKYVEKAIDAILAGTPVAEPETHSIGCTIKWKY